MTQYDFDAIYDRIRTQSSKWTITEKALGIPASNDLLPMWVADMDFVAPSFITSAVHDVADKGDFGYFAHVDSMFDAVQWWMKTRHGWEIETDWITPTASLGNAIAFSIQTWTEPGDAVAIFTPVYHEFASKVARNGRTVTELPLTLTETGFLPDFETFDGLMTGREKMLLLSSPHNPGGHVWTPEELRQIVAFCERHDLLLVSDEVHHDLILSGHNHVPTAVIAPEYLSRMVIMTSASKTFSIAGTRLGCVTIPDQKLRKEFRRTVYCADLAPNLFGTVLTRACYTPEGAQWVDALNRYLSNNADIFAKGITEVPGLSHVPLQGTYLAWVDFSGTGMNAPEIWKRVTEDARLVPSPGAPFGTGGELGLRFNLGTQVSHVEDAVARLQDAFGDLQ
ncbi:MalY/PatB family protein [Celeribacter sp. PS-C1]|uniref:MalY/PatB family protein n=1 Tax=Celeribacter sp. PS-C1 TaxID=2820813 RepID=UPI001CA498DB|nr:PatB family C-S lyase [Celeribacter sp. PS-C1]MBW6416540.1 PatB family C-S lyase [Celeribacter sp. PS-C1]